MVLTLAIEISNVHVKETTTFKDVNELVLEKLSEIDVTILHYTKIEQDRKAEFGTVLTQNQADKMAREWKSLDSLLKKIFPRRDLKNKCVSP